MHGCERARICAAVALVAVAACAPAPTDPVAERGAGRPATSPVAAAPSNRSTSDTSPHDVDLSDLTGRWVDAEVVRGQAVVVVGAAAPEVLHAVAEAGDEAWGRCRERWPEPVPPGVLVVPADEAQAKAAARDGIDVPSAAPTAEAPAEQTAGPVATTVVVGRPPARARVHLMPGAPGMLSDEGLRVVLTHECVHVALSTRERPDAPRWLVEGAAEVIAYNGSSIDRDRILQPVTAITARTGRPPPLPDDRDFDRAPIPGDEQNPLTVAYATAMSAADSYARRHGTAALVDLIATGTPQGRRDRAGYDALAREVERSWQQDLRSAAAQP